MDKKEVEKQQRKKSNEKFNSITQKEKVENQNQTHNARKEGISPLTRNAEAAGGPPFIFFQIYNS